jgi:hypothetical protein
LTQFIAITNSTFATKWNHLFDSNPVDLQIILFAARIAVKVVRCTFGSILNFSLKTYFPMGGAAAVLRDFSGGAKLDWRSMAFLPNMSPNHFPTSGIKQSLEAWKAM